MNSKAKAALAILGLTSAIAFALPAAAQGQNFYVGGTIGQAEAKDFCDGVPGGLSCDEKDTAWRILGGYQFNPNFALEFGYHNFGEVSLSGPGGSVTIESTAWELLGVGSLQFVDKLSGYAKIGLYRAETDANINLPGFTNLSESNTDLTFGIGLRYDFTRNLGVRAEWQRYQDVGGGDIGEADIDVMSVGIIWRF